METPVQTRYRHRIPCSLSVGGRQHSALVLNVSQGGLFVRTTALARRGDQVELDLPISGAAAPIGVRARVVWRRVAHSAVSQVSENGLGLRISRAPVEYKDFLGNLAAATGCEERSEVVEAEAAPAEPAQSGSIDGAIEFVEFEILMKQLGQPRSRSLQIAAADEEEARAASLEQAGEGWEILEVRRRDH